MVKHKKLVIRADAYFQIGTGHVMRCLAFAKFWPGDIIFISYCNIQPLIKRIQQHSQLYLLQNHDSFEEFEQCLKNEKGSWMVLDGYYFTNTYHLMIKQLGYRLLVFDDYAHLDHYHCDILLNQNYGASNLNYSVNSKTRLLLGTKYIFLREEFLSHQKTSRFIPEKAKNLFVSVGGIDQNHYLLKLIKGLNHISDSLNINMLLGFDDKNQNLIQQESKKGYHRIRFYHNCKNIIPLMLESDLFLSAGGMTVWELAYLELSGILMILYKNQENAVKSLDKSGIFYSLGWLKYRSSQEIAKSINLVKNDKKLRSSMILKASKLVDGKGIPRVLSVMENIQCDQ